jgi:hypothetical protein
MKQQQKIVLKAAVAVAILAVMLVTAACPARKSIAEINRDPSRYGNREIGVAGHVVSSWGALGTGLYQIDDGTGKIWVLSNGYGVPSQGAKVAVAGYVQPTFSLAGRNFTTVLKETRRRH